MTELQWTEWVIQFIWGCWFSANCLIIPISSNIAWWNVYEVPFFQFKWLSVCQNIEEYIPVLVYSTTWVFRKATLSYPLYELINKTVRSPKVLGREGGRCLPGHRCSGPCGYRRRSLTFRPRVQCCVVWYNALPAHLLSTIERVQMRALRTIYLRKLYNLLESLELRTDAVGSAWAL